MSERWRRRREELDEAFEREDGQVEVREREEREAEPDPTVFFDDVFYLLD